MPKQKRQYDVCIIGGAGHIGLPLGVAFANAGVKTVLLDVNRDTLQKINAGEFPFMEENGVELLGAALKKKTLVTSNSPEVISESTIVITVIGTPVDQYLNPDLRGILKNCDEYFNYFKNGQILILRSTIYPGTTERVQKYFSDRGKNVKVAFCPERIAQGKSLTELKELAQIVSANDPETVKKVSELFKKLTDKKIIVVDRAEAELVKLFSNAWRYISFAAVNQFFMIAQDHGLDYHRIYQAMTEEYPRNQNMPTPGFAAGPCLLKDTLQLVSYNNNNFLMGYDAMLINEGLPNYLMQHLKTKLGAEKLKGSTLGILGMAFKANNDDKRESLSYKLRKYARFECKEVFCHDVYIKELNFLPLETVIKKSDIIILGTPHKEYKKINPEKYKNKTFLDIWNFWPKTQ